MLADDVLTKHLGAGSFQASDFRDNHRLTNTVVAMITSRTKRANEPTQLFIDIATAEGRQTGLLMNSVVNCINVFTLEKIKVLRTLGRLSPSIVAQVDACLKAALGL